MSEAENIMTDITVSDIHLMLQIIEVCAKRGAFHATEFVTIGNLTAKLTAAVATPAASNDTPAPSEPDTQLEFTL